MIQVIPQLMPNFLILYLFLFVIANPNFAQAAAPTSIKIAAAADLRFVMQKLITQFQAKHPSATFSENYGSSGNFVSQLKNGADYDIFFSANKKLAEDLVAASLTEGSAQEYAIGILVLCGAKNFNELSQSSIKKIAIANPSHAPYGEIALEAMKSEHIFSKIESKLVFGDSVSQAAQFIQIGAASAGLISKSLSQIPSMKAISCFEVDASLYKPLHQSFVVLKTSKQPELAKQFAQFILSPEAKEILKQNGFKETTQE